MAKFAGGYLDLEPYPHSYVPAKHISLRSNSKSYVDVANATFYSSILIIFKLTDRAGGRFHSGPRQTLAPDRIDLVLLFRSGTELIAHDAHSPSASFSFSSFSSSDELRLV